MNSLAYLVLTSVKNRVIEIVRTPLKLAVYLLIIAAIVGFFLLSLVTRQDVENFIDIIWLMGICFALVLLFFIISIAKGLRKGDAIFGMGDVNFLFVSPVNPRGILLYGVIRMMGMAFLAGIFIMFQGNSLGMWFGVHLGDLFLIFAIFILAVSIMQILSLLIYSLTNGRPKRKLAARLLTAALFVPMFAAGISHVVLHSGDLIGALEALLRSPVTAWTPFVGWPAAAILGFLSGEPMTGFLFLGAMLAGGGVLILAVLFSNPDYYEDVLVATETAFEKKRAKEEGGAAGEDVSFRKKVRVLPLKGNGANAIFHKHLRESFRANPLGVWGMWSIFLTAVTITVAVIIRINGGGAGTMLILLQVVMWFQLFLVGMGRGTSELSNHLIYMLPASAFTKLLWNTGEAVFKVTAESLVMFTVAGIILGASPLLTAATIFTYIAFTLMLIGIYYLLLRWTGLMANQGILVLIYIVAVFIFITPGLVPAIIIGSNENFGTAAGVLTLAVWQVLAATLCFWLSKGILHKCDIPSQKMWN